MKSKKESVSRDQIWKSAILVWSGHFHIFWLISIGPSETGSISGDFVQIFYIGFGRSITVKFDDGRSPKWPRESALHVFIFLFSQLKRWHLVSMPLIRSPTKKNKHINIFENRKIILISKRHLKIHWKANILVWNNRFEDISGCPSNMIFLCVMATKWEPHLVCHPKKYTVLKQTESQISLLSNSLQ